MEFVSKPKSKSVNDAQRSDAMLLSGVLDEDQLRSGSLCFEDDKNLLSFSSENRTQNAAFQLCYPQSLHSKNSGDFGTLSTPNMHVPFSGQRQLFTQTQWFELEQQALIYKYIVANVSVPSNLIIPIKKSFSPWALSSSISSNGSLSSSSFGWGPFHLGFPGSTDPEPGRCRRTDGKKWRCAKDAVHGHKYCDKHLNRGRHRSRKPVEGQKPDQSVTRVTTFPRVVRMAPSLSKASVVVPSGSCANAVGPHLNLNPSTDSVSKRTFDLQSISVLSPTTRKSSKEASFSILKPTDPFEDAYQSEFGFVSSDYLQNPCKNYETSFMDFGDHESQGNHQIRKFVDEWPKEHSKHLSISWQEETTTKPDWTKLSMSIPMVSSGFSSSASSPKNEKPLLSSPLRLGREFHQNEMRSGLGNEFSDSTYSPWESSAGGPLGEVLKTSSNKRSHNENNPSALTLIPKGWERTKAQFEPSPTGVLLKSTFGSVSNSSSGSSPRTSEVGSLCNDAPGSSSLMSSLPFI